MHSHPQLVKDRAQVLHLVMRVAPVVVVLVVFILHLLENQLQHTLYYHL